MVVEIPGEVERFPHLPLKEKEVPPLPKTYDLLKQQEKPLGPSTRKLTLMRCVWRNGYIEISVQFQVNNGVMIYCILSQIPQHPYSGFSALLQWAKVCKVHPPHQQRCMYKRLHHISISHTIHVLLYEVNHGK